MALFAWVACAQPTCPDLAMEVRSVKKAAVGGTVTVKAKVRNTGTARQQNVAIMITLPESVWSPLHPVATAVKQRGALAVSAKYQAPGVYWLPLSLPAGKGAHVRVKERLAACPALAGLSVARYRQWSSFVSMFALLLTPGTGAPGAAPNGSLRAAAKVVVRMSDVPFGLKTPTTPPPPSLYII